jgi:predicted nucleic acid-binding protein
LRFWDTSAIVPLIVTRPASEAVGRLLQEDGALAVWWGTWAEGAVTISRLGREGELDGEGGEETRDALDLLAEDWREVEPTDEVRLLAALLSQWHPLKAADAFQLAAAFVWRETDAYGDDFVCLDDQLRRAASYEGFDVLPEEVAAA